MIKGYHYGDGVAGDSVVLTAGSGSWSCGDFEATLGATYTVGFTTAWKPAISYVYLCNDEGVIKQVYQGKTASTHNEVTFTVTDEEVTKIYVRSLDYESGAITATMTIGG